MGGGTEPGCLRAQSFRSNLTFCVSVRHGNVRRLQRKNKVLV